MQLSYMPGSWCLGSWHHPGLLPRRLLSQSYVTIITNMHSQPWPPPLPHPLALPGVVSEVPDFKFNAAKIKQCNPQLLDKKLFCLPARGSQPWALGSHLPDQEDKCKHNIVYQSMLASLVCSSSGSWSLASHSKKKNLSL